MKNIQYYKHHLIIFKDGQLISLGPSTSLHVDSLGIFVQRKDDLTIFYPMDIIQEVRFSHATHKKLIKD